MTFLNPWAFGFLGIVPVIVLLYFWKIKRRTVPVSTLMFWQRVMVDNPRRALFHRLRQLLSLFFHLLIFALILLALARPDLARVFRNGASTVLVADTRARMQAMESGGESRFEKARREMTAYARHASAQNTIALLAADAGARVAMPFSDDEKNLRQAIVNLAPTDAGGDLDVAIKLARGLLAARAGEKRIVVFTDRPLEPRDGVECVAVGQPHDNLAITQFAARPMLNSPQTSEIFLELRNFGTHAAHGNVELFCDEKLVDTKPFDLASDSRRAEIFSSIPQTSGRGQLRAHLDVKDALAVDNDAFAVLPSLAPKRVLLVTRGNWFIEKMLEADNLVKFELLTPDAFTLDLAKNFDAVILDDALPANFDLETARGNFLFVKQTPFSVAGTLDQPLVSDSDALSPLLRLVALQNVTFLRASIMNPRENTGGWRFAAPLRSFDHPLIITGERGEQRIAALAFDVAETDLPLRVAFPLLMSNTLQWLAGERGETVNAMRAGETIALARGQAVNATRDVFQPLNNGWYPVQDSAATSWIAVNTFSETESDLRFTPSVKISVISPPQALARFANWPLWMDFALAALALFTLEWWLFHKRRTE